MAGFPWLKAFALAFPAFGLGVGGGFVGLTSPLGLGLLVAGLAYLAVDLAALQPRVARPASAADRRDRAAQVFLDRGLALDNVSAVADQLAGAAADGLGSARAFLLAPGGEAGVQIFGPSGSEPPQLRVGAGPALEWLGERDGPVGIADVEGAGGDGAAAVAALLNTTACDVALPLRYRGLLLGVALLGGGDADGDPSTFYRAIRAYATVAVANTFLGESAAGGDALTSSLDLATAAQESIMPEERVYTGKGYALKGVYRPAAECGGDLWAWRQLEDGRLLVLIGDATGHGAAPALLAASARGALDGVWQQPGGALEPAELLSALNRAVYRTGRRRYLMTAFALVLDPASGEVIYANAGQNFPYVLGGETIEALVARGNPLGSAAESEYETESRTLAPGQRVLLFSDGIVEAEDARGTPFGERRFRAAVKRLATERIARLPDALLAAAVQHAGDRLFEDDLTLVVLERTGGADGEAG